MTTGGGRPEQLLTTRPFHLATGSLAAGLALSPLSAPVAIAAAVLAGGLLLLVRAGAPPAALTAALLLTGAAVGDARSQAIEGSAARIRDGPVRELRAYVTSLPRPSGFGSSAVGAVS